MLMRSSTLFLCIISFILYSCGSTEKVSLVVHNAVIYTVDDSFTVKQAMAIGNGKIIETGTNDDILQKYKGIEILDAGGKAIFPGFIDAHCHFTGYATDRWKCDLVGTNSWNEVLAKLAGYGVNAPMEWIYGRGWDQNDWQNKNYPDKSELDSMFPTRPVYLKRIDGHAAIANTKALQLAGITPQTKVKGGAVEVKNGKLTGLLIDNAMGMVESIIPHVTDSLARRFYKEMEQECLKLGLTSLHDCGVSEHTVDLLEQSYANGDLNIRIYALLSDSSHYYDNWIKKGRYEKGRLTVGGFKLYADGALGSRGACLLQNYSDSSGWKGFLLSDTSYFIDKARRLFASNLQMCTHAIGDSGNRQILKTYAQVLKGKNDRRWRIEHAQVISPGDFNFFTNYSIIPSVQPTHATSDMYWAGERLGNQRIKTAYAYKQLLGTNGWLPLGTDFPVEAISPFKTFYAAVARMDEKGFPENGFQAENALTREDALRGMTIWAAKAAFQENEKGSLEKGKLADFIMLDQDIMKADIRKITASRVVSNYINGVKVWSSEKK